MYSLDEIKELDKFIFKYRHYILGFILLYAFILRVLYLGLDSMWIDETISAVAAKGILENGYPLLESGETYFRAYLFHYLMAFFMLIFGENDFGARFISVIFGVLTVFLGYVIARKFTKGSFLPLFFALLLAVSSLEIIYSKQARFYQGFQFFYFLSFFLFYKFIILKERYFSKRWLDYGSLLLLVWLTIHLQFMGYILIPLFFGMYLLYNLNFRNYKKMFYDWKFIFLSILLIFSLNEIFGRVFDLFSLEYLFRVYFYGALYLNFYYEYFPLVILSLLGLAVALYDSFKLNLSFFAFMIVPFIGIFFVSSFATRYVYFAMFVFLFYLAYLFSKLRFRYLFALVLLVFYSATLFSFDGIERPRYDISMPIADYKEAHAYYDSNYSLQYYPLIVSWAPASVWYGENKHDHWVKYSVSGRSNEGWTLSKFEGGEVERFSGSQVISNYSQLPKNFILILDEQAKRKVNLGFREVFNNCTVSRAFYNIEVLTC